MKICFAAALFSAYWSAWLLVCGQIEFTNLKCISLDKTFSEFEYCFLKSVNRSYKYMSLKANLLQSPLRDFSLTLAFLKKANGFKPFLYNITFDACKFLKTRKANKVLYFFYTILEQYSNMNHTCPFENEMYIEKAPLSHFNHMFGNMLPLPEGEYQLNSMWSAYNIPRVHVILQFMKRSD